MRTEWQAAIQRKEPTAASYVKRSFMAWPVVSEICQLLEPVRAGVDPLPEKVSERLVTIFSCPGTNTVETIFQTDRGVETRHQMNKQVSSTRKWYYPISGKGPL